MQATRLHERMSVRIDSRVRANFVLCTHAGGSPAFPAKRNVAGGRNAFPENFMVIQTLKTLYHRDLEKLRQEIGLYRHERTIWKIDGDITNSAGNLCLHIVGNLNAFIGAELGKTGYIRDRDLEFLTRETPRDELLRKIDETIAVVANALDMVSNEQLEEDYPLVVFAEKMSTGYFLIHLTTHLNYHLGQINYHRRLLDKASE